MANVKDGHPFGSLAGDETEIVVEVEIEALVRPVVDGPTRPPGPLWYSRPGTATISLSPLTLVSGIEKRAFWISILDLFRNF